MPKTRYAFRGEMTLMSNLDPQAVGDRLDELIDEKQEHVTPDEIVADARPNASPFHDAFTWDENEAADKWRRGEAKRITTQLVTVRDDKPTKTRAFIYLHHPEHGGKKVLLSTRSAMARPELREQVVELAVRNLKRSLSYWSTAYGGNASLRHLLKDVKALQRKVEQELMATV